MNKMKKYDVYENDYLLFVFEGNENEISKLVKRLNELYEHTGQTVTILEHEETKTYPSYYLNSIYDYDKFVERYHRNNTYKELKGVYNSDNKYTVSMNEIEFITNTAPNGSKIDFIDISSITDLCSVTINPFVDVRFDTSHVTDFRDLFSYRYSELYKNQSYQYDLDWMYIKKGAIIADMFLYSEFSKKLPKMETKISFNQFVKRTGLIVTPELLKNNDMSADKWCKNKHNQKLMKNNEQYKPMLEFWINSDFITVEERINAMQVSGIEIFDI